MSKKKKSNKTSNFNAKEFMLLHAEKFVFGLIAVLAVGIAYLGFSRQSFDAKKTPDTLKTSANDTLKQVKDDHWVAISKDVDRVPPPYKYEEDAGDSAKKVDPRIWGEAKTLDPRAPNANRRSDPTIHAPIHLEPKYFSGAVLSLAASEKLVAKLNDLIDAKEEKKDEKKPKENKGSTSPYGGSQGAPSGYGGGGGRGGPGGGEPAAPVVGAKRFLAAGYDRGFPSHSFSPAEADREAKKKAVVGPKPFSFIAVNALAPHAVNELEYAKSFARTEERMEGRDDPIYSGFEVQRVDVTDNPAREVAEADWQPLPEAGSEFLKDLFKAAKCGEVCSSDWISPNITMSIPPVLLKDYQSFSVHSEIPLIGQETAAASAASNDEADASPPSAGGSSMPGGYGGNSMPSGYGNTGPPSGYGGGGGSSSMPAGYGASGAPSGYGGGSGASSMPSGYGGGGPPSGYGGGSSGMPSGYSGAGANLGSTVAPSAEAPKKLASTKYKAIRFYDLKVAEGHVYRYRVRLSMYDPNLPEAKSIQPRSSLLNAATLQRVQPILQAEAKDATAKSEVKRKSARLTEWSEPSSPISATKSFDGYVSDTNISYAPDKANVLFETGQPSAEVLFAEWIKEAMLTIPRKEKVERGTVFGKPNKDNRGAEAPFEVIHPISKLIKAMPKVNPSVLVAMIDIKGMLPLEEKPSKSIDRRLRTGAEAVAYDPVNNQIIVMREFDDFTGFNMYSQPDQTAVGPLGGPMKIVVQAVGGGGGAGPSAGGAAGTGSKPSFGGAAGGNTGSSGSSSADSSN